MWRSRFFLCCLLAASCRSSVETYYPQTGPVSESVYASGTVKSQDQYQVFAPVNGLIRQVFVKEGDWVKKGQVLFAIDNRTQELNRQNAQLAADFASLDANQGKLNNAQSQIDLAKLKVKNDSVLWQRQKALWQDGIGTKVELENRELAFQTAQANLRTALQQYRDLDRQLKFAAAQSKKALSLSAVQVGDFLVKSDIDGRVFQLNKEQGEITTSQNPLAVLGNGQVFVLTMQVDEYDIMQIKLGQKVLVTMDAYRGKVFTAKLSRILPIMNERSKSFTVEAVIDEGGPTLYPNISFEANIVLQEKPKALLIPRQYVLGENKVIKANGDTVVIKTGLKDYSMVEVLGGLSAQDGILKPGK